MSGEFEYNAPRFVDFQDGLEDSDGADTFFDVEETSHKEENKENRTENTKQKILSPDNAVTSLALEPITAKVEPQAPSVEVYTMEGGSSGVNFKKRATLKAVRRSLSGIYKSDLPIAEEKPSLFGVSKRSDLPIAKVKPSPKESDDLSNDLKKLSVRTKRRTHFEGIPLDIVEEKYHSMVTRKDGVSKTPKFELRSRTVNKESAVRNLKRKSTFSSASDIPEKYKAMAEQVFHFQRDTPPRFHTTSRRSSVSRHLLKARLSYRPSTNKTVALTPKLMTAERSRHPSVLSQEEREELEVEAMKKCQVKALPLNEKVLQPPKPVPKPTRPRLVPEPFNLTDVFKKPAPKVDSEPYKFTANPVPKTILKRCVGVGPKPEMPITVPQSPAITKSARHQRPVRMPALTNDNEEKEADLYSCGVPFREIKEAPKKTQVMPFSFEARDKVMMEKKEKKIQEIYEAERKAREFKANPVPAFVASRDTTRTSHMDTSTASQLEQASQPFRARSPRVLRKSPFKPKLEHSHSQPLDVQLNTQHRAREREQFEIRQLEKEELMACQREMMELEKKRKEEAELARLRQESVHKAQPMPKFKPIPKRPPSTIPLTDPKSPKFSKRTRANLNPLSKE